MATKRKKPAIELWKAFGDQEGSEAALEAVLERMDEGAPARRALAAQIYESGGAKDTWKGIEGETAEEFRIWLAIEVVRSLVNDVRIDFHFPSDLASFEDHALRSRKLRDEIAKWRMDPRTAALLPRQGVQEVVA